jgi:hypothetical protein
MIPKMETHSNYGEISSNEKIKGVRINCIGDEKVFNKPHFEAVDIPRTHPIFLHRDISDIAKLIGLPIFTRRCPPNSKWAKDQENEVFKGQIPTNNPDATVLHLCCDLKAEFNARTGVLGWGWAAQQWQSRVGSVIVVRQDIKPLLQLHVEALCKYCRNEILPHFEDDNTMSREEILGLICRPTFATVLENLLEENRKEGKDTDVPSPYKI